MTVGIEALCQAGFSTPLSAADHIQPISTRCLSNPGALPGHPRPIDSEGNNGKGDIEGHKRGQIQALPSFKPLSLFHAKIKLYPAKGTAKACNSSASSWLSACRFPLYYPSLPLPLRSPKGLETSSKPSLLEASMGFEGTACWKKMLVNPNL